MQILIIIIIIHLLIIQQQQKIGTVDCLKEKEVQPLCIPKTQIQQQQPSPQIIMRQKQPPVLIQQQQQQQQQQPQIIKQQPIHPPLSQMPSFLNHQVIQVINSSNKMKQQIIWFDSSMVAI
ncbi:hypothetical protein ACTFIR_009806 [Dictyostelium discoideum]